MANAEYGLNISFLIFSKEIIYFST